VWAESIIISEWNVIKESSDRQHLEGKEESRGKALVALKRNTVSWWAYSKPINGSIWLII